MASWKTQRQKERVKKQIDKNVRGGFDHEIWKTIKYMCSTCKFYIDKRCSKERIIRICRQKGLKNKEE
jgi:hypothetical protein